MPQQTRTRLQVRQDIGLVLKASYFGTTTSTSSDTTSVIDTNVLGGTNDHLGKWIRITSGSNAGETKRVSAFNGSGDLTTSAFTNNVAAAVTFELWESSVNPDDIDRMIDTAITQRTPRGLVSDEDISVHGVSFLTKYSLPSGMVSVSTVQYRDSVQAKVLDDAQSAWTESTGTSASTSRDTEDYRYGGASMRIDYTGSTNGIILTSQALASTNLSGYDYLEFWIKADTATAANDLRLILSASANGGAETDLVSVPALTARTWQFVRVALGNPENNTAIISIALEYNANAGTNSIWLNRVKVTRDNSATWEIVDPRLWRLDKEANELVLQRDARSQIGHSLLQLIGYRLPVLPTADSSSIEVSPDLIKARVVSQALMSLVTGRRTDQDNLRQDATWWEQQALQSEAGLPLLRPGTRSS